MSSPVTMPKEAFIAENSYPGYPWKVTIFRNRAFVDSRMCKTRDEAVAYATKTKAVIR